MCNLITIELQNASLTTKNVPEICCMLPPSLWSPKLAQIFWQALNPSCWLICSKFSRENGHLEPVHEVSAIQGLNLHPAKLTAGSWKSPACKRTIIKNQHPYFWGFQAVNFRWCKISHQICLLILGMIIPVLGRWAPLRPFILILCNVRIDQHPGILVSSKNAASSCVVVFKSDFPIVSTGSLSSLTFIRCWYYSRANI